MSKCFKTCKPYQKADFTLGPFEKKEYKLKGTVFWQNLILIVWLWGTRFVYIRNTPKGKNKGEGQRLVGRGSGVVKMQFCVCLSLWHWGPQETKKGM